jgi:hypothetical protein
MEEMFPRPIEAVQSQKQKQYYILQKAKETIQLGEKKVEGFNFTASVSTRSFPFKHMLIYRHLVMR